MIAVRTPNWLGDTVMSLPALAALRVSRPEARIVAVGRWAPLLAGQGVADVLLGYPRSAAERLRFGRALRGDVPDLAVLLANSFEAALAAWWWGARRRLGFDTDGRRALLTDAPPLPSPRRHQVDEYGVLLASAGVSVPEGGAPAWRLPPTPPLDAEVDALLAEAGAHPGARVVGLHLGAAFGASKLWPSASFGRLAAQLERAGYRPLLMGTAGDSATAREVSSAAGFSVPSLVGRDRPSLLPALLSRLACLVSGDTGVAHLAAALAVPTVTLFGPTDPALSAPRSTRARAVAGQAACSPCFLAACPIDHACLRDIGPEAVLARAREAMGA